MFEYFLLVTSLFVLLLFYFQIRDIIKPHHALSKVYTDPEEKLVVFDEGEDLQIEGGEAEPFFYYKVVEKLRAPDNERTRIEFICGATVLIEQKHAKDIGASEGKTKNFQRYHPLFEFAHDHPERVKIFLRTRREGHRKHYSVGTSPRLICEEDLHKRGDPKKGTFYYNDVPRWQVLKRRIEQNKRKCVVWNKDTEVPFEVMTSSAT